VLQAYLSGLYSKKDRVSRNIQHTELKIYGELSQLMKINALTVKIVSCHVPVAMKGMDYQLLNTPGIRVENTVGDWYSGKNVDRVSRHICRQCPGIPPCAAVCPENTYYRDKVTGAVLIDDEKCVRCQTCIEACPYDAIWYSEELDKILKCDLDQGKVHPEPPECVQNCSMGLLKYVKIA